MVDLKRSALRFALALDQIDLDRYLPPPQEGKAAPAATPGAAAGKASNASPTSNTRLPRAAWSSMRLNSIGRSQPLPQPRDIALLAVVVAGGLDYDRSGGGLDHRDNQLPRDRAVAEIGMSVPPAVVRIP